MSEKGDWIRLLVKYRGKCTQCGKEIPQGSYALWSRTSKTIKHVICTEPTSVGKEVPPVAELDCFVCGKPAGCAECGFESDCNRALVSQACICGSCLAEKGAYQNYQQAFLAKAYKAAKVRE